MNWYLAKLSYRIICGNGKHTAQFDEQLRLISAETETQALLKAKQIGAEGAHTFFNDQQQLVQWQFISITELHCISNWTDGAEVYSAITEADSADAYINFVTDKASSLDRQHLSRTQLL